MAELQIMCTQAARVLRFCELLGIFPKDDHPLGGPHRPQDDEDHFIWDDI